MRQPVPLSLVPGSWDDLIARLALKLVDWTHDRLSRRVPTLAAAPLPPDPWARLQQLGGNADGGDRGKRSSE